MWPLTLMERSRTTATKRLYLYSTWVSHFHSKPTIVSMFLWATPWLIAPWHDIFTVPAVSLPEHKMALPFTTSGFSWSWSQHGLRFAPTPTWVCCLIRLPMNYNCSTFKCIACTFAFDTIQYWILSSSYFSVVHKKDLNFYRGIFFFIAEYLYFLLKSGSPVLQYSPNTITLHTVHLRTICILLKI